VLSGRSLCEELITRPEESYRLCYVVVCDLENLKNEEAMTPVGSQRHLKKKLRNGTCRSNSQHFDVKCAPLRHNTLRLADTEHRH